MEKRLALKMMHGGKQETIISPFLHIMLRDAAILDAERNGLSRSLFLEITSFIRGSDESFPAQSIKDKDKRLSWMLPEYSFSPVTIHT